MSSEATYLGPRPAPASILGDWREVAGPWWRIADARLSALSAEVVHLFADHLRRAPSGARSMHLDVDYVVTTVEDCLTPAERALVEDGQPRQVERRRIALSEVLEREFLRIAERALGRVVLAHRSRVVPESGTSFEVFVLAGAGGES